MKYLLSFVSILSISFLTAQDRSKMPDVPGDLMIDIGLNYWSGTSDSLEQRGWPSKAVSIYYVKRKAMSEKVSFIYGLGLGLDKIDLGTTNYTLYSSADSAFVNQFPFDPTQVSVNKNKLATTYLEVPLEIRFHPGGTEEGEGVFIGVGAIGGLFITGHTRWKYDLRGENVVQKTSGRFDINSFRYGAQFRFGFRGIHLFYKTYFSKTFRNGVNTVNSAAPAFNPTMQTFGINLTGF
jgi:hypothetical protein